MDHEASAGSTSEYHAMPAYAKVKDRSMSEDANAGLIDAAGPAGTIRNIKP